MENSDITVDILDDDEDDDDVLVTFRSNGKMLSILVPKEGSDMHGEIWAEEPEYSYGLNLVTDGHYQ